MSASTSPIRVAWIDPTGPADAAEQARVVGLGFDARHLLDPSQLITSLVHVQVLVVRVEHNVEMLQECLTLAQMPGRRLPVVCRVPPHRVDLAAQATRLGADHVLSTQDWSAEAWEPVGASQKTLAAPVRPRSVVFVDPASQQLLALAQKVAQTEVSALLVGPTGAGKEVLARVLHEASPRTGGPFVSLNCGALPEQLIEDMLFGHEKGAFSGAIRDHQGVFEQAQGGTVFLDEIGEMPLHLQTRLLRVLQERCITRLGGSRSITVDVRIVAATNKDLKQAMLQREFREDLYFRISTFTLRVLPLAQRPMDILPLAAHVLQQHGAPGLPYRITDEARRRLLAYHWPGNVRELGNVIQRALVLCPDRTLTEDHLLFDDDVFGQDATPSAPMPPRSADGGGGAPMTAQAQGPAPLDGAGANPWAEPLSPRSPMPTEGFVVEPGRNAMPSLADGTPPAASAGGTAVLGADQPAAAGLQWAVRHSELRVILDAIRNTSSREAAARMLGISPRTLRYKLAQMRDLGMMTAEAAN
ncbi:MAG: sigma-54-dependent Fis family transcriptional regulator [Betaproteobacteria bacterium]|nr:sigma-54-dependent Fis family transcriptional regulator [Betaproteobacteria bacterium]NBT10494.1 sigma-54-dependent Fis family transcriptional regulator [Betaproteobacteria bacterium]NBU50474.1 sigma-54-dependent Fis family transcriptional regulator [Betaproteobacteria bacterium]